MDKTIFVLLDACQYEAASKYLGYLEHMIDYNKGAKYKVLGELPVPQGRRQNSCYFLLMDE